MLGGNPEPEVNKVLADEGRSERLAISQHEKAEGFTAMFAWAARWLPPKMLRRVGRRLRSVGPHPKAA